MKITVIIVTVAALLAISVTIMSNSLYMRTFVKDHLHSIKYGISIKSNILVPMRDGTRLATHVMMPNGEKGPYPTLLLRTTYASRNMRWSKFYVNNGYAVVVQDVRGRAYSEGAYEVHKHSRTDAYDTMDWIKDQPWSSGKIGSFGCSFAGEDQNIYAAEKHPNHIAMISDGAGGAIGSAKDSYGYFGLYENGVFNLASGLGWFSEDGAADNRYGAPIENYKQKIKENIHHLPIDRIIEKTSSGSNGYRDYVMHKLTDPWWHDQGYIVDNDTFSTAVLHVNSWFDQTIMDTFRLRWLMENNAENDRAKHQYLLIGPGTHCTSALLEEGVIKLGEKAINYSDIDYKKIYLDWFDFWLKGEDVDLPPKVMYYVINEDKWMIDDEWPPKEVVKTRLYLGRQPHDSTGKLELNVESSGLAQVSYEYDPDNPVPTLGGPICCTGNEADLAGMVEQSKLRSRKDVLEYQSKPLDEPLIMIGSVVADLSVATDAEDTDFTLKLLDVSPTGKVFNIQDGVSRLRYRKGVDDMQLAEPGEIYQIQLGLRPIAYKFERGHRIGIMISSSNFPRLARNLNTGEAEYSSEKVKTALNTLYHNEKSLSYLTLPFVENPKFSEN
jgi:putative CocE/NonD family hydrolase